MLIYSLNGIAVNKIRDIFAPLFGRKRFSVYKKLVEA
jgi:hypothetical protein